MLGPNWFLRKKDVKKVVAMVELTSFMATSSLVLILVPKKYEENAQESKTYHDKYLQRLHTQVFLKVYTSHLL